MERSASFGEWLTEYRQSLHLQRAELAARIGCAAVTLRKIEIDERRPSRQMAEQLAEQLGISPGQREIFVRVARGEISVSHLPLPKPAAAKIAPTNLPHPTTSFAGRAREVEEIQSMLSRPDVRMLTLTGAPGVGKTRLALEAATNIQSTFRDGVFFVALAPLNDPALVLVTIAHTLQLGTTGKQPLAERLGRHLRTQRVLLVLDNFEHVLAVAPQLTSLLEATLHLKLLVTSRIALELSGEHRLTVLPLGVPPDLENSQISISTLQTQPRYSAVDLFIQRARTVKPDLVLTEANLRRISQICRRLDGLPLAIEFVAARCAFFTPQELLTQLDDRFALLTSRGRDLPVRHLTLWQALDWSYSLLSPTDQKLFQRLSVFVGSFTLEAAQEVCNSDNAVGKNIVAGVTTLLTSSLLERQEDYEESSRFRMLQTVREYAFNHLTTSGEVDRIRRRHAAYFLGLVQTAERAWDGPAEWEWLRRLVTVRDDLRAALRWTLETSDYKLALGFNAALFSFWTACSALSEARSWLEAALALPIPDEIPEVLAAEAKVLNVAGYVTAETSDYDQAYRYFERGLALYRKLDDSRGIAWSIRGCAFVQMQRDEYETAGTLLHESLKLCESGRDEWGLAWSLYALAFLKLAQGDLTGAQIALEEALVYLRRKNMTFGIFRTLLALGYTLFEQGNVMGAEGFFREALLLNQKTPLLAIIMAGLEGLAAVAAEQGRVLQAARLWGAAETMREVTGQRRLQVFQRSYARLLKAARSQVEAADWDSAWAEGRNLTAAQAVAEALEKDGNPSTSAELLGDPLLPL